LAGGIHASITDEQADQEFEELYKKVVSVARASLNSTTTRKRSGYSEMRDKCDRQKKRFIDAFDSSGYGLPCGASGGVSRWTTYRWRSVLIRDE